MSVSHRISVLGKELQVKSSASLEAVREVEAFVNGKVSEVAASVKGVDSQVVAILTLMNIAEAYLALARESAQHRQTDQDRVHRLLQKIDGRTT